MELIGIQRILMELNGFGRNWMEINGIEWLSWIVLQGNFNLDFKKNIKVHSLVLAECRQSLCEQKSRFVNLRPYFVLLLRTIERS